MTRLLENCRSVRVISELAPWLSRHGTLPTVAIVGTRGVGKRRLLRALAGLQQVDDEQVTVEASIVTKYYSARVRFCVVDVGGDEPANETLLASSDAILLVWRKNRLESFEQARRCFLDTFDGIEASAQQPGVR